MNPSGVLVHDVDIAAALAAFEKAAFGEPLPSDITVTTPNTGQNNMVLVIAWDGWQVCVKRYKRDGRMREQREWEALCLLDERAPGIAPRPLALRTAPEPLVVMSFLAGMPRPAAALDESAVSELAATMRRLHAACDGRAVRSARLPLAAMTDAIDEHLAGQRRAGAVGRLWRGVRAKLPGPADDPVLGHNDGNPDNVLWHDDTPRLVDFEYAGASDAAYELALAIEHPRARDVDDDAWDRLVVAYDLGAERSAVLPLLRVVVALYWMRTFDLRHDVADHESLSREQERRVMRLLQS